MSAWNIWAVAVATSLSASWAAKTGIHGLRHTGGMQSEQRCQHMEGSRFMFAKLSVWAGVAHFLGAVALVAASLAATTPVASGAATGESTSDVRQLDLLSVIARAERVEDASLLSSCPITVYGYTGYRICEFGYSTWDHGGGVEWFVVGSDYAVWHAWPGSGGWHSLGGQASRTAPNGAYTNGRGVATFGTDGRPWCRDWPWNYDWYRC